MPSYKLIYFDGRGLGESIRWLFKAAGVPFEDCRIPHNDQWPAKKAEINPPWGKMPLLEVDGKRLAESGAILRYLGRVFNMAGSDAWETAKCDEIGDAMSDYFRKWVKVWMEDNEEKRKELLKNMVEVESPVDLGRFDNVLAKNGSGYFVGKNLTWVDIMVIATLSGLEISFESKLITDKLPHLAKLSQTVKNIPQIKEWIAKRPETKF